MADIEALPPYIKGEILDGVLYPQPRPRALHQNVISLVDHELFDPYRRGRGGPGGWWLLPEPGIELLNSPEVAPDIAGWLRERMPELPFDGPIRIVPDWVCEVFMPKQRQYILDTKLPFYARVGVRYCWLLDLAARTFTASRLDGGKWVELGVFAGDQVTRAEPFEAAPLDLSLCWSGRAV